MQIEIHSTERTGLVQVAEAIQLMISFGSLLISLIGLIVVLLELHSKHKK